ncbi:MAG: hypothetical protein ABI680_07485 [Chthoniobacteraceae bacterium]
MKRVGFILIAILVAGVGMLVVAAVTANPIITWRTFEQRFPAALHAASFNELASQTESSDQVSLPLSLHVRQILWPEPPGVVVFGFPESVVHYTLQSGDGRIRMECLVRYSGGKVARIVLRYPIGAESEALRLRDALRQTFSRDRLRIDESPIPPNLGRTTNSRQSYEPTNDGISAAFTPRIDG